MPEVLEHVIRREANWDDVFAKAQRLMESGAVTIKHNAPDYVSGTVVGDHGVYDFEFSRQDPTSMALDQWSCQCPWDAYAWGRTRQWKKYEGRPCSHLLAGFWQALKTPLDFEEDEGEEGEASKKPEPSMMDMPTPASPGGGSIPFPSQMKEEDDLWQVVDPKWTWKGEQGTLFSENPEGRKERDDKRRHVIPDKPDLPFKHHLDDDDKAQMKLFDVKKRKKGPSRFDLPGAYSSFIFGVRLAADKGEMEIIKDMLYPRRRGMPRQTPVVEMLQEAHGEMRGGKVPCPWAQPAGQTADGNDYYDWRQMGWDPDAEQQVWPPSGGPEQRGRFGSIPAGARCEVLDFDAATGMVYVIYSTDMPELNPHLIQAWVDAKDIKLVGNQRDTPFVRRA